MSEQEIISLFGPTEDVVIEKLFNGEAEFAKKDYYLFYESNHDSMIKNFPLIQEIIKLLKRYFVILGIFTGKGRKTTDITLKKLDFAKHFDYVITGDDVLNHKPHPEGIFKIMKKSGITNNEKVLLIGDSPADIIAARGAQIKIASVLWDSYAKDMCLSLNPDYVFWSPLELYNFFQNLYEKN
jgi:HAD superfamily hydrolase (TIGR01549 family)